MMSSTQNNFFKTSDDVVLYFEDAGAGAPILLVPGLNGSTEFWKRNVPVLSMNYRVITYDPRGFGRSSKPLQGNTIKQHARDLKELIEHLGLKDIFLIGWSLGGTIAVNYCHLFGNDQLKALGILDSPLYPFSSEAWNKHSCRGFNIDCWLESMMRPWYEDIETYVDAWIYKVFGKDCPEEDKIWLSNEIRKLPPWIGTELHMDYCHTDSVSMLKDISVPVIIYAGNSVAFPSTMSESYLDHIKTETVFHTFATGGHALFYKEHEKFNRVTLDFINKVWDK